MVSENIPGRGRYELLSDRMALVERSAASLSQIIDTLRTYMRGISAGQESLTPHPKQLLAPPSFEQSICGIMNNERRVQLRGVMPELSPEALQTMGEVMLSGFHNPRYLFSNGSMASKPAEIAIMIMLSGNVGRAISLRDVERESKLKISTLYTALTGIRNDWLYLTNFTLNSTIKNSGYEGDLWLERKPKEANVICADVLMMCCAEVRRCYGDWQFPDGSESNMLSNDMEKLLDHCVRSREQGIAMIPLQELWMLIDRPKSSKKNAQAGLIGQRLKRNLPWVDCDYAHGFIILRK